MAIISCRECAHQVSDQAASCPNCGAPVAADVKTKPRGRHYLSKALITLMTLWTLGTLLWLIQPDWGDELMTRARGTLQRFDQSIGPSPAKDRSHAIAQPPSQQVTTNAPPVAAPVATQPPPTLRPVYRTTAEDLYRAYEANAVATQTRIGNSVVRINGSISGIDQDEAGHPVIKLRTGKDSAAAMTLLDNQRAAAAQLYKGEAVDLDCDKIGGSDAILQGSGCTLEFVDIRTREVNLALFLTNEGGGAHVYVVGPMPEAVCRAHSEEISSRLRVKQRGENLVWRSCTDAGRENILPGGCHLNSPSVTLPDVPSAHLWHYDCGSANPARATSHRNKRESPRAILATASSPAKEELATEPAVDTKAVEDPAPTPATSFPVEAGADAAPAPQSTAPGATNNLRFASAGRSDIGGPTAPHPVPTDEVTVAHASPQGSNNSAMSPESGSPHSSSPPPGAKPDDLAQIRAMDPQAANHIAAYCSRAVAGTYQETLAADCRRNEIAAWTRLVLQNEFPTLNDEIRQKCSEPPFPDTYVAKESCARYELHAN